MPPSLALVDPAWRFWRRAAVIAPLVGVCVLAAAAVTAAGFDELRTVHASLRLCWSIIVLATGAGLWLRWRLTGEAPVGLLGAALLVWSLPQLPFALADVAVDPDAAWRRLGPMTRMTVMVPAAWLLLRCIRAPQVDSTLRPLRDAVGYSCAATAAAAALATGQAFGVVAPPSPLAGAFTGCLLATLLLAFAGLFAGHRHTISRPVASRVAVAFTGLGVAAAITVAAPWSTPLLFVLGELVAVICAVLLLLVAVSLLSSAVDFYGLSMLSLRQQADCAEDAVRREEERMHEVRATVAGIRQASGTLSRYAHRLDPNREHDLQQMMAAELQRLERLLSADWQATHLGPVMLDDLIRPQVIAHREQGATAQWRPTHRCAVTHGDAVAEILAALLSNTRTHAPEAAVEVVVEDLGGAVRILVRDDGPGMPPDVRDRPFERGTRGVHSPGEGLGLHIAAELAEQAGGELALLPPTEPHGTCFALTLPAVSDPTSARPAGQVRREGSG